MAIQSIRVIFTIFVLQAGAFAASVTTSAECRITPQIGEPGLHAFDSDYCYLEVPTGYGSMSAVEASSHIGVHIGSVTYIDARVSAMKQLNHWEDLDLLYARGTADLWMWVLPQGHGPGSLSVNIQATNGSWYGGAKSILTLFQDDLMDLRIDADITGSVGKGETVFSNDLYEIMLGRPLWIGLQLDMSESGGWLRNDEQITHASSDYSTFIWMVAKGADGGPAAIHATPEPSTLALALVGIVALFARRRIERRRAVRTA